MAKVSLSYILSVINRSFYHHFDIYMIVYSEITTTQTIMYPMMLFPTAHCGGIVASAKLFHCCSMHCVVKLLMF